ncbi:MAG: cysteine--tRNA ligase [Deltaproteobacteria bacterium]|nr:cysteine--tRNA ligase [Deltaproteobacteria bacterium]
MSGLRLTNTYSRAVEPFAPLDPAGKRVLMYSCGPTVYSFAHIGNFRSFLFADVLRRVLERDGFEVRHVMNITDVGHLTQDDMADAAGEDKLLKAAQQMGWDPYRVAQHFLDAFVEDAVSLRLRNYQPGQAELPELHPRATRYIPEMLAMIQQLIEKDHAYVDSKGQVYYSIESFPEYGRLSNKVIDDLESGARVEVREEKRDPRDFALWKVDTSHLMQWDPHGGEGWPAEDWARLQALLPNGVDARIQKGFPGWHIECSAMSLSCLAEAIDIHTGGEDNIFPHHECEIAQSCGALDVTVPGPTDEARRSFARFWVHGRHLLVDGRKMSKRDGTFFTVKDLLDPVAAGRPELGEKLVAAGFEDGKVAGVDLRLALLWGRYSQPMNFNLDLLGRAKKGRLRLQTLYERALEAAEAPEAEGDGVSTAVAEATTAGLAAFLDALHDDLNMDKAMAAVFEWVTQVNTAKLTRADAASVQGTLESFDQVLDVLVRRRKGLVSKDDLAAWCDPEALKAKAASYPAGPVQDALTAGATPALDVITALTGELDDAHVVLMVGARHAARKNKDFAAADGLRNHMKAQGIVIEDVPQGVRWRTA